MIRLTRHHFTICQHSIFTMSTFIIHVGGEKHYCVKFGFIVYFNWNMDFKKREYVVYSYLASYTDAED
jgi:hypothetical protein